MNTQGIPDHNPATDNSCLSFCPGQGSGYWPTDSGRAKTTDLGFQKRQCCSSSPGDHTLASGSREEERVEGPSINKVGPGYREAWELLP